MRVFFPPTVRPQIKQMKILCSEAKYNWRRREESANFFFFFFRTLELIWVVRREFGFPAIASSVLHALMELTCTRPRDGLEDREE